jgi:methylated-DNA-protein-cysteine methyltransferase-like protein
MPTAELRELVYRAVRNIPRGRASTYGWIAELAGLPGRARFVGACLNDLGPRTRIPWHRVVASTGRIALPAGRAADLQRHRLEAEGIVFVRGRIALERYGWPRRGADLDALLWGPSPRGTIEE